MRVNSLVSEKAGKVSLLRPTRVKKQPKRNWLCCFLKINYDRVWVINRKWNNHLPSVTVEPDVPLRIAKFAINFSQSVDHEQSTIGQLFWYISVWYYFIYTRKIKTGTCKTSNGTWQLDRANLNWKLQVSQVARAKCQTFVEHCAGKLQSCTHSNEVIRFDCKSQN